MPDRARARPKREGIESELAVVQGAIGRAIIGPMAVRPRHDGLAEASPTRLISPKLAT